MAVELAVELSRGYRDDPRPGEFDLQDLACYTELGRSGWITGP
jgi:hypothetical protein